MPDPVAGDTGLDIDATADSIGSELFGSNDEPEDTGTDELDLEVGSTETENNPIAQPAVAVPVLRAAPKSWAKESHAHWSAMPKEAQDQVELREKQMLDGIEQYKGDAGFAKEMREIITPYRATLAAQGVSEKQAVQYLLNAHFKLTNGSVEERTAAYRKLGADLGMGGSQTEPDIVVSPELKKLQNELDGVKSRLSATDRAAHQQALSQATAEADAFEADPANVYFKEVSPDMVGFVKQGLSLKDAYDKAVWANPVTRTKELGRIQTENATKLKENARLDALKARDASRTNVRDSQSRKAPTEPKGKFLDHDSMMADLATIRQRTN